MLADYERIENNQAPIFLYLQTVKKSFNATEQKKVAWHCVEKRKHIERLYWEDEEGNPSLLPTVYIDADADQEILRLFVNKIHYREYYAKRRIKLWQLASTTNSCAELKKEDSASIKRVQKRVNYFAQCFKEVESPSKRAVANKKNTKNVLLITYKELIDDKLIKIPVNCTPIYFGGYRGIDHYKDYEACIIIGRFQIPIDAIERYGIGLWYDAVEPLELGTVVKRPIGYRLTGGKKLGVNVLFPADARLQSLTRQLRECETLQGIDRLRVLHEQFKRAVFLLSNIPLDIDVDQLCFHPRSELKINKIIRNATGSVISLLPSILYRDYPHYFQSEYDASQIVQRWKALYLNDEGYARMFGYTYQCTQYKYNPKGGRSPYCLYKAKLPNDIIIKRLKIIHGADCTITLKR